MGSPRNRRLFFASILAAVLTFPGAAVAVDPVSIENTEPVRVSIENTEPVSASLDPETIATLAAAIASASVSPSISIPATLGVDVQQIGSWGISAIDAGLAIAAFALGIGLTVLILDLKRRR